MTGLGNGKIVHYVMKREDFGVGSPNDRLKVNKHRPALVVENWGHDKTKEAEPSVNLLVFLDGENDDKIREDGVINTALWKSSAKYSEKPLPGTWHWPED